VSREVKSGVESGLKSGGKGGRGCCGREEERGGRQSYTLQVIVKGDNRRGARKSLILLRKKGVGYYVIKLFSFKRESS
jgi:hypothetical protein